MADTPWIDTDDYGLILDCHEDGGRLLGYTVHTARGQSLLNTFLTDRPGTPQFARALLGHPVEREGMIRPREGRAVAVRYRIEASPASAVDRPVLRWTIEPM